MQVSPNDNLADIEREFVSTFTSKPRRERYLGFLETKAGRKKLTALLPHSWDFDPRFIIPNPSNQQKAELIQKELELRGAGKFCAVISEDSSLDGTIMNLSDALKKTVGWDVGTVLICDPGKLAYYEPEDVGGRVLLFKVP